MRLFFIFLLFIITRDVFSQEIPLDVYFHDTFNNNQNNWDIAQRWDEKSTISGGMLIHWAGQQNAWYRNTRKAKFNTNEYHKITFKLANLNNQKQYSYKTFYQKSNGKIKEAGNVSNTTHGVIFGYKDGYNYHAILFNSPVEYGQKKLYYKIFSMVNGSEIIHQDWVSNYVSSKLNAEVGFNEIFIKYQGSGSHIFIYAKGFFGEEPLGTIPNNQWFGKEYGIYVGAGAKVALDDIKVEVISKNAIAMGKGNDLFGEEKYKECIPYFMDALRVNFFPTEASYKISLSYSYLGNFEKAKEFAFHSLKNIDKDVFLKKEHKQDFVFYNNWVLGKSYFMEGNLSEAKKYWLKAGPIGRESIFKDIDSKKMKNDSFDLNSLYEDNKEKIAYIYTEDEQGNVFQGSGVVIKSNGIVISNYHVFSGTSIGKEKIFINGKAYRIENIIEKNTEMDYIIFKIKNNGNIFQAVNFSTTLPNIGEECFAIGNPKGLEKTLSKGIISGIRDNENLIQTTAEITHGSSGGALFNNKGEVIGITTSGMGEADLNFAINILKIPFINKISVKTF